MRLIRVAIAAARVAVALVAVKSQSAPISTNSATCDVGTCRSGKSLAVREDPISTDTATCVIDPDPYFQNAWGYNVHVGRHFDGGQGCEFSSQNESPFPWM